MVRIFYGGSSKANLEERRESEGQADATERNNSCTGYHVGNRRILAMTLAMTLPCSFVDLLP